MLLSKQITIGAVCCSLILGTITLSYLLPVGDFSLFTLTSLFVAVAVMKAGFKTGWITYIVSSVLITILFSLYYSIPFILFFGIYPVIKGLAEKASSGLTTVAVKAGFFITVIFASLFLFENIFKGLYTQITIWTDRIGVSSIHPVLLYGVVLFAGCFIYDYALSLLITFFKGRIKTEWEVK